MWKELIDLFQNSSDHKKLALKDKLQNIKVHRNETIPPYLSSFTQCHEELGKISVTIEADDLVGLSLLGLPKSWHNYQDTVNGRKKLPNW